MRRKITNKAEKMAKFHNNYLLNILAVNYVDARLCNLKSSNTVIKYV